MKPLISFFQNDLYFYSENYNVHKCNEKSQVVAFLNQINNDFHENIKIVKFNFDTFHEQKKTQTTLFQTPLVVIYILKEYEVLKFEEIKKKYDKKETIRLQFVPLITKNEFESSVQSIVADIAAGRFYQINFTSVFKAQTSNQFDSLSYFLAIADKIYSPYKAYLPNVDHDILCFSPELFLSKNNDTIITQPIKGTLLPNQKLTELTMSNKENSELSMIVDLLRNDLNKLSCEKYKDHSVVNFHRKLMDLKYTVHTYSEVSIKSSLKLPQILENIFPGGSISGCPKIESLHKITECEKFSRDFYTGSIGWWQKDEFCLNIAIRSFCSTSGELFYFAGCGIVYDSLSENEWVEFLTKARFLNPKPQEIISIVDTILFIDQDFTLIDLHIDRTLESFAFYNKDISREMILYVYDRIREELRSLPATEMSKNGVKVRISIPLQFDIKNYNYHYEHIDYHNNEIIKLFCLKPDNEFCFAQMKNNLREHWDNVLKSKPADAHDILIINHHGHVTESSIYSLFYKKNGKFYTPPLNDGCLNGVLRKYFLNLGSIEIDHVKYPISEKSLHINDINSVEIYVGNSVRGLKKARVINPGFCD